MKPRRFIAPSAAFWLLIGFLYFFIPLLATFIFSLKSNQTGKCCTAANYSWVIHNGDFWHSLKITFLLALETIVICLVIFVPTIYWVHLKLPRLRPVIAFFALIPFVVPPIVMVVGLLALFKGSPSWFYAQPWGFLAGAYVILAFPYMFFSLDAGFRSNGAPGYREYGPGYYAAFLLDPDGNNVEALYRDVGHPGHVDQPPP